VAAAAGTADSLAADLEGDYPIVTKLLSMLGAAIVGGVVAFFAVTGVVNSTVGAPDTNPANGQIIQYGDR
jgi:hypothetical protein